MTARIYTAETARALREAATPGPWVHDGPGGCLSPGYVSTYVYASRYAGNAIVCDYPRVSQREADANADLIVAAWDLCLAVEHWQPLAEARAATLDDLRVVLSLEPTDDIADAVTGLVESEEAETARAEAAEAEVARLREALEEVVDIHDNRCGHRSWMADRARAALEATRG